MRKREIHTIWREASMDHPLGKGWVNAKIGRNFVTFNDLGGHTSVNEIFAYS